MSRVVRLTMNRCRGQVTLGGPISADDEHYGERLDRRIRRLKNDLEAKMKVGDARVG